MMKRLFPLFFILFAGCIGPTWLSTPKPRLALSSQATADTVIYLSPSPTGDCISMLEAARDYAALTGAHIVLNGGSFPISRPWILAQINVSGKDYNPVTYHIKGKGYAFNTQPGYTSTIIPLFTNAPAVIMQDNKGSTFEDISITGKYTFPLTLNATQVDTMTFAQWTDSICADNATAPYAGIVVDPFSSPNYFGTYYQTYPGLSQYYIPGMSRNGSTGIKVQGCAITQFVVGVLVTGGTQYNGECIKLIDNKLQNCKVEFAYSQAQSKANILENTIVWGNTHTIIDGQNYGFSHNDASTAPFIDVMNVAGNCHQLFNVFASTFPFSAKRIYAEGLFKIGIVRGLCGAHFDDLQLDFQNAGPGSASPEFYYGGYNTIWTGCMLRLYNGKPSRIVLDFPANIFYGGSMNAPPIQWNTSLNYPLFTMVSMFYYKVPSGVLSWNGYETRSYLGGANTLYVDRGTFNGYFVSPYAAKAVVGETLVDNLHAFGDQYTAIKGSNVPIGFVTSVVGDTVNLSNIGYLYHTGDVVTPVHYTIKVLP